MSTRCALYPIQHPDIWEAYKKQQAHFWTAEEIRLTQDTRDWLLLDDKERLFLKHVLAFFAGSDGVVAENIGKRFIDDVEEMEAKICYGYQAMMEGVHAEMYSILLDTLVRDVAEKARLFSATQTIPCIAKKNRWAIHWAGEDSCYAKRLVAFACVEGILFSGSFCAIFWLKQRGLMPGLTTSNEFIARDEGMHTDFACLMYQRLEAPLDAEIVLDIVSDAVEIEKEFICESLPCSMLGMNASMMCRYIEFVADRLLIQLGYARHYRATNPFGFMERMSLDGKDNFFEKRVSAYTKAGVGLDSTHMEFGEEEAF